MSSYIIRDISSSIYFSSALRSFELGSNFSYFAGSFGRITWLFGTGSGVFSLDISALIARYSWLSK